MEKGFSACLIVKNEEKNIANCLKSLADFVNEILIIDTGSNDRTKEIAKNYTNEIYEFQWIDDFSVARNYALQYCNYSHILSIDADEILLNPEKLINIFQNDNPSTGGWLVDIISISEKSSNEHNIQKSIRIFRNDPGIKFEGLIHEQVINSILKKNLKIEVSPIQILHLGYDLPHLDFKLKMERNLKLLDKAITNKNNDLFLLFHRANTYLSLCDYNRAIKEYGLILKHNITDKSLLKQIYNNLAISNYSLKNYKQAIIFAEKSLELIENQIQANIILARINYLQRNFADAYNYYRKIEIIQENFSTSQLSYSDSLIPIENLKYEIGKCLLNMNLLDEAISEFEKGIKLNNKEIRNYIGLSNAAFKKGKYELSLSFIEKALQIEPHNTELLSIKNKINSKFLSKIAIHNNIKKPFLSLSMIVKNEEKYLRGCLESIQNYVDEIIIVDTGSSDKTKLIAKEYNAKIYNFEWKDDFSAARNEALKYTNGEWLIYLDADERLKKGDGEKLIKILKNSPPEIGAYVVTIESEHLQLDNSTELHRGGYPRIIRNLGYPNIHFIGRVHEQITPSIFANNKKIDFTDIIIEHLGYNLSREEMDAKVRRNYRMLIQHVQEEPLNGYAWYQLGQTLAQMKLFKEAEDSIRMAIQTGKLSDSVYASATATLSQIVGSKGNYSEALQWAEQSLKAAPEQLYALHLKAYALLHLKKFKDSEIIFLELKRRLNLKKGVPRTGFDIVIPEELVNQGLQKARSMQNL